jgi:hypothetical protein
MGILKESEELCEGLLCFVERQMFVHLCAKLPLLIDQRVWCLAAQVQLATRIQADDYPHSEQWKLALFRCLKVSWFRETWRSFQR